MYDEVYFEEENTTEEPAKKKTLKERYAELNQEERDAFVAGVIGLSTGTLVTGMIIGGALANNGKIPCYDVPSGRLVKVAKKDIFKWIKRCNHRRMGVFAADERVEKSYDSLEELHKHGGTIEIKFDKE